MIKYFAAYATTAIVMIALDLLWLGVVAKPLYQQGIGHLLADRPNIPVALLFYATFPVGLMVFAVAPYASASQWAETLISAALFGFMAYATYDLSNLATLKNWPVGLSFVDMAWGTALSATATAAGKFVLCRFAAG